MNLFHIIVSNVIESNSFFSLFLRSLISEHNMAKSVELLKEVLEIEERSINKFGETLNSMVHDESKKIVKGIINSKKEHIISIQKIIDNSRKCSAITN